MGRGVVWSSPGRDVAPAVATGEAGIAGGLACGRIGATGCARASVGLSAAVRAGILVDAIVVGNPGAIAAVGAALVAEAPGCCCSQGTERGCEAQAQEHGHRKWRCREFRKRTQIPCGLRTHAASNSDSGGPLAASVPSNPSSSAPSSSDLRLRFSQVAHSTEAEPCHLGLPAWRRSAGRCSAPCSSSTAPPPSARSSRSSGRPPRGLPTTTTQDRPKGPRITGVRCCELRAVSSCFCASTLSRAIEGFLSHQGQRPFHTQAVSGASRSSCCPPQIRLSKHQGFPTLGAKSAAEARSHRVFQAIEARGDVDRLFPRLRPISPASTRSVGPKNGAPGARKHFADCLRPSKQKQNGPWHRGAQGISNETRHMSPLRGAQSASRNFGKPTFGAPPAPRERPGLPWSLPRMKRWELGLTRGFRMEQSDRNEAFSSHSKALEASKQASVDPKIPCKAGA